MDALRDFLLNALSQFAGGPGPPENNLVRFGLAAVLWGSLLVTAWSRQRRVGAVRERLLVVGFGLAFFRELFKFSHLSFKLITGAEHDLVCALIAPTEHALTLISVVLISGAFLQYILDDTRLAKHYLIVGLGATTLVVSATALWWPQQLLAEPATRFHETWPAAVIHLAGAILILVALVLLIQRQSWGHAVVGALALLFVSELLTYLNFATAHIHTTLLCPIGNALYLVAIPLFGYVYYHEQQLEQQRAEAALRNYRDHLEELVQARTTEISRTNVQLQAEIGERRHAERELARRNAELAAQNALAATISQSLELDTVLQSALEQTLDLTGMAYGCVFLLDPDTESLVPRTQRSIHTAADAPAATCQLNLCSDISQQALARMAVTVHSTPDSTLVSTPLVSEGHAVGALTLGAAHGDAMTPEALNLLTAIGQQIGVAVEKAALHHQLELAATLEERQRIAAEMHDGLAQTLSYMGHKTDRAAELLEAGQVGQVRDVFGQLRTAIGQASVEVRRSIASLQERPAPRLSLQAAIEQAVADSTQGAADSPQIIVDDSLADPVYLPPATVEQITRVVQEALTNALRHSTAQTIRVDMANGADKLSISVEDNGRGFDPNAPVTDGADHFGLSIMRARAARVTGVLTIDSTPGAGTRVRLTLPLATGKTSTGLSPSPVATLRS